jgi:hypothetical protein
MSRNSTVGQMLLLRYLARLLPLPRAPAISALHACAGLACDERDGNRHPRDGGLADVERACDISLRFAISKALDGLLPLMAGQRRRSSEPYALCLRTGSAIACVRGVLPDRNAQNQPPTISARKACASSGRIRHCRPALTDTLSGCAAGIAPCVVNS